MILKVEKYGMELDTEEYDDMVYVSDLNNYELLYVNRAGLDMFHLSREEFF